MGEGVITVVEMIGKCSWILWSCVGAFLGKYCRRYVTYFLRLRNCESGFRILVFPFPELLNGLLWGVVAALYESTSDKAVFGMLSSLLFGIAVIDFLSYEIPPVLNGMVACLGFVKIATDLQHWPLYVAGSLLGGGIFLMVYLVTGKRGIGGGDIKLMAAAGLVLGVSKIFPALFLGCILAVLVQLPLKWFWKKNSTFALGPYLVVGIGLMVWFGDIILQWEHLLG